MSSDAAISDVDKNKIIDILKTQEAGKPDSYYEGVYNFYLGKINEWINDFKDKTETEQTSVIVGKYKAYSEQYAKDQTNKGASTSAAANPPPPQTSSAAPPPKSAATAVAPAAVVTPAPATEMKGVGAAGNSNSGSTGSKSFDKSKNSYKNDDGTTNKYILCGGIALAVLVGGGIAYTVYKSQKRVRNEPMIVN